MGTPAKAEIELKFPLEDPDPVRTQLAALGFRSAGEVFEHNLVFDTPEGRLQRNRQLLRLRQDRTVRLTFKEPPPEEEQDQRYKVRAESELEVGELETMRHILHRLGFTRERSYQKRREHFQREDGAGAELDRLPHLGWFLELEASPAAIEEVAAALGLDRSRGSRDNYFELFDQWREATGSRLYHLRFEDEAGAGPEPAG